jgi:hypothetical protein
MFRLDYLSCFLTIVATILVGRKSWTGLLISIVNSLIVCLIGFRTSQFGFIPANLFCICVYAFSIRTWLKKTDTHGITGPSIPFLIGEPRRRTDLSLPRRGRSGRSHPYLSRGPIREAKFRNNYPWWYRTSRRCSRRGTARNFGMPGSGTASSPKPNHRYGLKTEHTRWGSAIVAPIREMYTPDLRYSFFWSRGC